MKVFQAPVVTTIKVNSDITLAVDKCFSYY